MKKSAQYCYVVLRMRQETHFCDCMLVREFESLVILFIYVDIYFVCTIVQNLIAADPFCGRQSAFLNL